jgi:ribosomal peptide maturation radical SAM protein 1
VKQRPAVLLVAMPWDSLTVPSIQLGTLQAVLERARIGVAVWSCKLDFMEHCATRSKARPEAERIGAADYGALSSTYYRSGLAEWVFAVPPYLDTASVDDEYVRHVSTEVPEHVIAKAQAMRALVPEFLDRCVEEIVASAPDVVGFTSTFSQAVPSLVLSKLLKVRCPELPIVFGGANCEGPMGAALHRAFPWIDVVVRGEAERVLPDLVHDLRAGRVPRPLPGLCYRDGARSVAVDHSGATAVSMDEVPLPRFDEYFARLRRASFAADIALEVAVPYEAARGCWWGAVSHCTFCGLNGLSMAFRSKSPDRVVSDLIELATRHGRLDVGFVDNILDLRYLRDVVPRVRDAGHDFSFFCETKSNLKRDEVRLLREAGVDSMQPGIESLSTPILTLMRKGVTGFQNVRLLKWCAEYGVRPVWNIIYGFPGESPEEYERMAEVVPSLTHLDPPRLQHLILDRFSPYHARPGEFGLEVVGPVPHYKFLYPVDDDTLTELAYSFEYRYLDGRDPETYVENLRALLYRWQLDRGAGYRSLRYRRGPGFLVIQDRRPNLDPADYTYGELEAQIYLACADGATPAAVWQALDARDQRGLDVETVETFLDTLVARRLAYAEGGRYLSLALPAKLPEAGGYWAKNVHQSEDPAW